jgi:hypothetical protein
MQRSGGSCRRQSSTKPLSEPRGRKLTSAETTSGTADAAIVIARAGSGLPLLIRVHLWPLSSIPASTGSESRWRDSVRVVECLAAAAHLRRHTARSARQTRPRLRVARRLLLLQSQLREFGSPLPSSSRPPDIEVRPVGATAVAARNAPHPQLRRPRSLRVQAQRTVNSE